MNVSKSASEHNQTSSATKIQVIAIRRIDKGTVQRHCRCWARTFTHLEGI